MDAIGVFLGNCSELFNSEFLKCQVMDSVSVPTHEVQQGTLLVRAFTFEVLPSTILVVGYA